MEYLEEQIINTLSKNKLSDSSARVKIMVHRKPGGFYLPKSNDVEFIISVIPLETDFYLFNNDFYEIDLFKDYFISPCLLSTLKTNNKAFNVVGSIYANENKLSNCLVLNTSKNIVEALNANIFLIKDNVIKTPPLSDGCLNGVMRKQIIKIIKLLPEYELQETSISPFELQKADEMFLTNVIQGIQPISKYRKRNYGFEVSKLVLQKLNVTIRFAN